MLIISGVLKAKKAAKWAAKRDRPAAKGEAREIKFGRFAFPNVKALQGHVKDLQNNKSDGEELTGGDLELIQELLKYHPKGPAKSAGLTGVKIDVSTQGGNRCFYVKKDVEGETKYEDFSMMKIYQAINDNPPFVAAGKDNEAAAKDNGASKKRPAEAATEADEPEAKKQKVETPKTEAKEEGEVKAEPMC